MLIEGYGHSLFLGVISGNWSFYQKWRQTINCNFAVLLYTGEKKKRKLLEFVSNVHKAKQ